MANPRATLDGLTSELCAALGSAGTIIGPELVGQPRFTLFHAANSICSQKVRVVLAQHQISYTSHALNIFAGQTYLPDYVRMRLIGCQRMGAPLVAAHSGSTSTSFGGCDPAVVPTLVDWQSNQVIVDSKRICLYIDATVPENRRLRPISQQQAVDAELDIVDNLPNYQMLTGQANGADLRPEQLQKSTGAGFSLRKVERCDHYIAEFAADRELVEAYHAKRSKELDAANRLYTPEAMELAYAKATLACQQLNSRIESRNSSWLLGNSVTMADLFWAVELLRMQNLGAGHIWEQGKLPAVAKFVAAAEGLESVRSAVLAWPGALY
jgi:2,5-dichlorohydroquinone reductive dechlorinase